MSEVEKSIETTVFHIVTSYVAKKLESKHDLRWQTVKGTGAEGEYSEKRSKIAREAFLAVRARTGVDFVDYFSSTLCSVPQRITEETFVTLSKELFTNPDRIRTLTLLALSARS